MRKLWVYLGILALLSGVVAGAQDGAKAPAPLSAMDPALVPGYDVATIKPSKPDEQGHGFNLRGRHLVVTNMTLQSLITLAYNIHSKQLEGGPSWMADQHYDMDILPDHEGYPSFAQAKGITRKLLADRFGLRAHEESKELAAYVLAVGKLGSKLTKSPDDPSRPPGFGGPPGVCRVRNGSMPEFAQVMQATLDRPVLDQTGLKDRYDFTLRWTPDESQYGGRIPAPANPDDGSHGDASPQLFTAIQEQLGLKLEPKKAPVTVLVIDRIEKPSEN